MPERIIVIGGSPSAYEAVCVTRNILPEAEITLLEEGDIYAYSPEGMFYYLSGDVDDFKQLKSTVYGVEKEDDFYKRIHDIRILTNHRVQLIERERKLVRCWDIEKADLKLLPYDKLLLAPKCQPVKPRFPGIELPGIYFYDDPFTVMELRQALEKNQIRRVGIVGSGPDACRLCEAFKNLWGIEVELFCEKSQILHLWIDPDLAMVLQNELVRQKIQIHLDCELKEIVWNDRYLAIALKDGTESVGFDRIIFAAGKMPDITLAKSAGLTISERGTILVDNYLQTSDPNVFATGECVDMPNWINLETKVGASEAFVAVLGRCAGMNIAGVKQAAPFNYPKAVMKVFDFSLGRAGLIETEATAASLPHQIVRGLFSDRAFYYPEANLISAKLLFNPSDGAVLGLQMASKGDITRYLDTFSAVLMRRGKLSDLREFNPAFSAPLTDLEFPFHSLASYAMNLIAGGIVPLSPFDFEPEAKNSLLLDVREEHEIKGSPIKVPCLKILHLPFTQLKLRVAEIPRGLPLIALCARGSRSMNTANYLHKLGFDRITFLSGGLHFFQ